MTEVSVESVKKIYNGSYIDNDLIIFDEFADVPLPNEPRRMQCLLLALCINGTAEYTVDTVKYTAKANDIMIISEGQVTDNYMLSPNCRGIALMISYKFFSEIIKGIHELSALFLFAKSHPICPMEPAEAETIMHYFTMLKDKVGQKEHHFLKETVQSLLTTMIYDLSNTIYHIQTFNDTKLTRADAIFTEFIKLVEQNFRTERRVWWYGKQMCITPKYLSETIKQVSHRTPNEWIDKYVTLEIRVQLKNTSKSIKEISQDIHFPNQSFFGKYFKEHVGMSPSEYRRS